MINKDHKEQYFNKGEYKILYKITRKNSENYKEIINLSMLFSCLPFNIYLKTSEIK